MDIKLRILEIDLGQTTNMCNTLSDVHYRLTVRYITSVTPPCQVLTPIISELVNNVF